MKQVLQSLKNGETLIADIPSPMPKAGHVLIRTHKTLVSVGTEKMLLDFGRANWIQKARQQPDKVKMVLDKVKTDGVVPTYESIQNKLDQPIPMGYCNVGTVVAVGAGVTEFKVGDRVASNGHHAEVVLVPKNLCAKIPDSVTDDQAVFTVISAIALQGIRLVEPTLGETVVVMGLGLVGLLAVQLLHANGCDVVAIDFDEQRVELARQFGATGVNLSHGEDPIAITMQKTQSRGADAVVIAASTSSNEPMHQAATLCRQRGRVVLVGVVGLELSRADFYEKEISFQVSCSYGPGRYDQNYEQRGNDYPFGLVRWTEQRNFEAVLNSLHKGALTVDALITHRYPLVQADVAYRDVAGGSALGVVLECDLTQESEQLLNNHVALSVDGQKSTHKQAPSVSNTPVSVSLAMVGAGNYANKVLIPAVAKAGVCVDTIVSSGGVSGVSVSKKHGIQNVVTDTALVFDRKRFNTLIIATRHDTHADYACHALAGGQHVFVEKPLALNPTQLQQIVSAYTDSQKGESSPLLMVGFNRRFSPLVKPLQSKLIHRSDPIIINMTINAGKIPVDSWIQQLDVGGGRIIGEACHFVDLACYLAGSKIIDQHVVALGRSSDGVNTDKAVISLRFDDGSVASIQYLANGHNAFPKERIEVFSEGRVFQIDNFRALRVWGDSLSEQKLWRQDKGNAACMAAFLNAVETGQPAPIPFDELLNVTDVTLKLHQQILEQS